MKEELRHIMEVEKNGRIYSFSLQMGSPIGEAYDACWEIMSRLVENARSTTEKAKRQEVGSDVQADAQGQES